MPQFPKYASRTSHSAGDRDDFAYGLPLFLTAPEAAELLRISLSTLYSRVSRGRYAGAVSRGKPLLFHRDLLIRCHFSDH